MPIEQSSSVFRSQRIVASVVDLVLRTELADLEPQEDAPKRVLWCKPMSWLGVIRPHRRDELEFGRF